MPLNGASCLPDKTDYIQTQRPVNVTVYGLFLFFHVSLLILPDTIAIGFCSPIYMPVQYTNSQIVFAHYVKM
jgi:hypothetical protein